MMKTVELSGIIKYDDYEGEKIILINEDEELNLVDEFEYAVRENGKQIQLNYWTADKPCTKEEMIEGWLRKLYGVVETDCEEVFRGSWTFENASTVGYDKYYKLQIGGHNLFDELRGESGRFIILELNFGKEE